MASVAIIKQSKRSSPSSVVIAAPKGAAVTQVKTTRRRQRRKAKSGSLQGNNRALVTSEYLESLVDPFECCGPRLGWGCLTPSGVSTAYVRGTLTANADGTVAFMAVPECKSLLYYWNGGASAAATANIAPSDATVIGQNFQSGRPVSLGVRVFPSIAMTSAPGQCVTGALIDMNNTQLAALTVNDLITYPNSHVSIGYSGGSSTGRPIDVHSFEFQIPTVDQTNDFISVGGEFNFSLPYVVFTGLPASAVCYYEAAFNFEALYKTQHSSAALAPGDAMATLANEWPSMETMWTRVKDLLPPPGRPGEATASLDRQAVSTALVPYQGRSINPRGSGASFGSIVQRGGKFLANWAYNTALGALGL